MPIFTKSTPSAHEQFQQWRRSHGDGLIVKLQSTKKGTLHNTICQHLGDTTWEEGANNWGSMGNTTKVCFDNEHEVVEWVKKEGIEVKECLSCKPKLLRIPYATNTMAVQSKSQNTEAQSLLSVATVKLSDTNNNLHNLGKKAVELKSGNEHFTCLGNPLLVTLLDFWKWNESDLLSNATRGVLAEFIVAKALNLDIRKCREEWAAFDLETPQGVKIEVKSAAYLQTWFQKDFSKISFGTKSSLAWDSTTNKYEETAKRQADIYVFCLLKHKDKQTVNPLNLDQWEFYVLATEYLNQYSKSANMISLSALQRVARPVSYELLNEEVIKSLAKH